MYTKENKEIYSSIHSILQKFNVIYLDTNDDKTQYSQYLHDETFLEGNANCIVFPTCHNDVLEIINAVIQLKKELPESLQKYAQITTRGLGSGLSGGCVPIHGIILSTEKLHRIIHLDPTQMNIHLESGVITSSIHKYTQENNLLYPPDPSSSNISTIGGNIATNAAGPRSYKYGVTRNYVEKIRVVWADGTDDWIGSICKKSSVGIDLKNIIIGSEGQLCIVTEVILKLIPLPKYTQTIIVSFDSYQECTNTILKIVTSNINITCIEFIDEYSLLASQKNWHSSLHNKKALLLLEIISDNENENMEELFILLNNNHTIVALNEHDRLQFWNARISISSSLKKIAPYKIGEDICIPIKHLPIFLERCYKLGIEYNIHTIVWGHAGDGNLHINMLFHTLEILPIIYKMIYDLAKLTISLNGSVSGEHGLGRLKRNLQPLEHTKNLIEKQKQIKKIFDPHQILNINLNNLI